MSHPAAAVCVKAVIQITAFFLRVMLFLNYQEWVRTCIQNRTSILSPRGALGKEMADIILS